MRQIIVQLFESKSLYFNLIYLLQSEIESFGLQSI